nr:dihydrofolate reductase family protein [Deinococcus fonticola]
MRKVVAIEYVTLNNVMEAPVWTQPYFSQDVGQFQDGHLHAASQLLLGRVTYEGMSEAWPQAPADEGGFAERINTMPKEVVTSQRGELTWNSTALHPDELVQHVKALRQQDGANILIYGSGQVVRPLLQADLLDELHLLLCPVSVEEGKKLFEGKEVKLKPARQQGFSGGMTLLSFVSESAEVDHVPGAMNGEP